MIPDTPTYAMIGNLVQWWLEVDEDEVDSPEADDILDLFIGADINELCRILAVADSAEERAAAVAALGALVAMDTVQQIGVARDDDDPMVRLYADWAIRYMGYKWAGVFDLWDMLYLALFLLPEFPPKPRQMSLF